MIGYSHLATLLVRCKGSRLQREAKRPHSTWPCWISSLQKYAQSPTRIPLAPCSSSSGTWCQNA